MEFEKLEKEYKNFYVPSFKLYIENDEVTSKGMEIVSVMVDVTLNAASQATFTVSNAFDIVKREIRWFKKELWVNKRITITMGYTDCLKSMFIGIITGVKLTFPATAIPQLEVTALDLSHPMTKNKCSLPWDKRKDSQVVSEISSKYNLKEGTISETDIVHETLKQDNESDYEFLRKRANDNSFEFFVFGSDVFFRYPAYREDPIIELEWGKTLISFSPELDITNQVEEVEVWGWDKIQKKKIVGTAKSEDVIGKEANGSSGAEIIRGISKEKVVERVRRPVYSEQEAKIKAVSILTAYSEGLIKGSGECLGLPEILPGNNITVSGIGKMFSRKYYIEKATHTINNSGYKTSFNVKQTTI